MRAPARRRRARVNGGTRNASSKRERTPRPSRTTATFEAQRRMGGARERYGTEGATSWPLATSVVVAMPHSTSGTSGTVVAAPAESCEHAKHSSHLAGACFGAKIGRAHV